MREVLLKNDTFKVSSFMYHDMLYILCASNVYHSGRCQLFA